MAKLSLRDALNTSLTRTKQYIDTELAKKANSSHGTHVTYGGNGSATTVSRSDHTHSYVPIQVLTSGDLDTIKTTGYYSLKNTLTNSPTPGHAMLFVDFSIGTPVQIFKHDATFKLYHRTWNPSSSTWSAWTSVMANDISGNAASATTATLATLATTASKVSNSLKIQLNGGTTEGTNQFTFDGSAGKSFNITPGSIGAAYSSHGTHLTLGITSSTAYRGDFGNTAYTHSQAAHAPSNAQKNSDITKAEIEAKLTGAITTHTHSYLPLSGGTMTGKITTPNNAQGITIGDDIHLCDRNIADHLVLEGSTATNGGITFGSGKDTNIYRGGANILKTDDTMNAVGGFQWNGQSLDSRYAAASHGTHLTIGTGSGNAAAGNHTHNYAGSPSAGGAANSANILNQNTRMDYGWNGLNYFNISGTAGNAAKANDTPTSAWWHIIRCNHANSAGFYTDIAVPFNATSMYYKRIASGAVQNGGWVKMLDSLNWSEYAAAKSHGTHVSYGGNGSATTVSRSDHTHNAIISRGAVTAESGVAGRPAVSGLSMSEVYSNGYPTPYGNVISLRGMGDGHILVGWSGTDGAHAPVYVRSKRDNTSTANWSDWAQFYTTANKPTASDIGAAASSHTHNYAGSSSAGGTANSVNGLTFWTGTLSAYNALSSKSSTTVYLITG